MPVLLSYLILPALAAGALGLTACTSEVTPTSRALVTSKPSGATTGDVTAPTFTSSAYTTPSSPHWSTTPELTLSISEIADVTLYSDADCKTAISVKQKLTTVAGQTIQMNLSAAAKVTTIYAEAIDKEGNSSGCVLQTSYTSVVKLVDPNPGPTNSFGVHVVELTNGNIVVTSSGARINGVSGAGAVYLFNGTTGALISTLYGSSTNDGVGSFGVTALTNGNFVVRSASWDCTAALCPSPAAATTVTDVGAVTWVSGTSGLNGPVSSLNSLVGSTSGDTVGLTAVVALTNGNYVVASSTWDCSATLCPAPAAIGATVNSAGAVTWGSGTTGISGPVTSLNSLVGSTANDEVGSGGVTALSNGNYVVRSANWDCSATLCPSPAAAATVTNVGAVTWGSGSSGISGPVNSTNSLVGSTASDAVGTVFALTNGNYVVASTNWDCTVALCPSPAAAAVVTNVGAVTFASGSTGTSGPVSSSNSLVGMTSGDQVGTSVTALTNGHYVVASRYWDCTVSLCPAPAAAAAVSNVGAATWGSGTTGITGVVSSVNSLVGSTASDEVGISSIVALSNGNYVVPSPAWDCTTTLCPSPAAAAAVANVGAATWGSGTSGVMGPASSANSLVGSTANDYVSTHSVVALTNGNYLVRSGSWDCTATLCPAPAIAASVADVGALTWGSGSAGVTGPVSSLNSLVGSTASDGIGNGLVIALTNGNYVAMSSGFDCTAALCPAPAIAQTVTNVGHVTWGSGTTGISGPVTSLNSLVGSVTGDMQTGVSLIALTNGNYVVSLPYVDCTAATCPAPAIGAAVSNTGAVTWGSGTSGVKGPVTSLNSLVGSSTDDIVGNDGVTALTTGNYVIRTRTWDCKVDSGCSGTLFNAGAITFGSGTSGVSGPLSTKNSLVGSQIFDTLGNGAVTALSNGNYVSRNSAVGFTKENYLFQASGVSMITGFAVP